MWVGEGVTAGREPVNTKAVEGDYDLGSQWRENNGCTKVQGRVF